MMDVESAQLKSGMALWKGCYGGKGEDAAAYRHVQERVAEHWLRDPRSLVQSMVTRHDGQWGVAPHLINSMLFAAKWVDSGCRTIAPSDDKYFAAMAQTHAYGARDFLKIPWPAFSVRLPRGMLVDSDGHEYVLANFAEYRNVRARESHGSAEKIAPVAAFYQVLASNGMSLHSYWPWMTLAELLFERDPSDDPSAPRCQLDVVEHDSDARLRELVKRATVGLLYTMQHTKHWSFGSHLGRPGGGTRTPGPPVHRTVIVGRPIDIDVRAAVTSDSSSGSRSGPSVQTLVRGHMKRQAFGRHMSERKVIWVEPYWRGPEDAPILARPYAVRGAHRADLG